MRHAAALRATFNEAIELVSKGSADQAEKICRDSVERHPQDANMTALLGAIFLSIQIVVTGTILITAYIGFLSARAIGAEGGFAESSVGRWFAAQTNLEDGTLDQFGLATSIAINLLIVLVFLQNWRATIIPMVAVPVSLIGLMPMPLSVRMSHPNSASRYSRSFLTPSPPAWSSFPAYTSSVFSRKITKIGRAHV